MHRHDKNVKTEEGLNLGKSNLSKPHEMITNWLETRGDLWGSGRFIVR